MFKGFMYRLKKEIEYLKMNDWSLQDVAVFWDGVFEYEDINKETYSYFRRFTDGYHLSSIPDNSYVLDICCRTGNGVLFFWQKGKVKKAVCADVSASMLNVCKERLIKENAVFETKVFSDYYLPFDDREFDAILCFETVEHVSKPDIFIKELGRIIKKNGEMILTTPNILWEPMHWFAAIFNLHHSEGPHKFIKKSRLNEYLKAAGFNIVKEDTTVLVPGGPKGLVKVGEFMEKKLKNNLMPLLGLRRIFICKKK